MKKLLQSLKTNVGCRFALLFLSVPLGMLFLVVSNCFVNWLATCLELSSDSRFIDSLSVIILGLPVFIVLWFFRTWDTKEQLAKSQEQINQNNYSKGLDNLFSKENLKVEIASHQLIALSEVVKKYKEDIQLAFIKRLKSPLSKEEGRYFSYAQYIVDWLSENYHSTELDLDGCNFDYQEFKIKANFDILRNKENSLEQLSFVGTYLVGADLRGADLRGTDLRGTDLSGADLKGADLREADLREADLHETYLVETYLVGADLRGANLKGVDLKGVDFGGADLKGVDLSGAYLSGADLREAALNKTKLIGADLREAYLVKAYLEGANLSGANLSGADLSGANLQKEDSHDAGLYRTDFTGALFNKNQHPAGIDFETLGYKLEDVVIGNMNFYRLVKKNS